MNNNKPKTVHQWLFAFYGLLVGLSFPVLFTIIHLRTSNLTISWKNFFALHSEFYFYLIVDSVPLVMAFFASVLGKMYDRLSLANQKLVAYQISLEENNLVLNTIFNHTPIAYAVIDKSFRLKFVNKAVEDLLGRSYEAMKGQNCYEVMGEGKVCTNCAVSRAFKTGRIEKTIKEERNSEGQRQTIEAIAVPIKNGAEAESVLEIVSNVSDRVEMLRGREEDLLATIDTLVALIELKDSYTGGHSQRVRKWALAIGQALNLSEEQLRDLEISACLHDIGKIGIKGMVLNKSSDLTNSEYEYIKQHPIIGQNTLSSIKRLKQAGKIIRHHHEFYDGSGYPDGLSGDQIPLGARIIAVADAYDAMVTERSYRAALTNEEAISQLKKGMGSQFDPIIVQAFINLLEN